MKKIPVVRQTAWQSVLFQFVILAIFVTIVSIFQGGFTLQAIMIGVIIHVVYQAIIKILIERPVTGGIKLIQKRKFEEAISLFEKAYQFYSQNKWIDQGRYFLLISSNVSFREMTLVNIAFCYSQIGNGLKSKEYYQRILAEFPESAFAEVSLNAIKAFEVSKK